MKLENATLQDSCQNKKLNLNTLILIKLRIIASVSLFKNLSSIKNSTVMF